MFTKEERIVILFLVTCLALGVGVDFYRKATFQIASPSTAARNDGVMFSHDDVEKIDINTAGFGELIKLKGVGGKTALDIIDFRKAQGRFSKREDIMQVKGIGQAKFDKMKHAMIIK